VTPIIVPDTVEILLETNLGMIESPVKMHRGSSFTTSVLMSTATGGSANVAARVNIEDRFKLGGSATVVFSD